EQCELEMISGGCDKETHIRRFRTKLISMGMCGYDRVIVEPSGIFDVDEFFDVLHEEPLDNWYEIGNVIAVVDAELENELSAEADYLLASEAANAGKILLSHADEADGVQIEQTIAHLNRAMEQIGCKRRFDTEIVKKGTIQLTNSDLESFSLCGYVYENYQKMDLSEQNGFQSLYFMNSTMSEETLKAAVKKLFADENCGNIFRIKGFLKADNDKWLELNATHSKITLQPIAEGQDVLIVIGERLNKEAVESYIQSDSFRM
ncbi:MAG: GTP-binding protein, partial [Lachnospira sp.]